MKSRGKKGGKAGRKGAADVAPSTSLPPLVQGQLRCFLRVTVSRIVWTVPRPPRGVLVRLRWWGETSGGTVFCPRDTSQAEQQELKTTAQYSVHCGPRQLSSYLTDMGALVFEVLTHLDHLPIGRAQIGNISRLSSTRPLGGFFPVVSSTSEKLGELQVSVALEPLHDDSSSIIIPDMSQDIGHPPKGETIQPRNLSADHRGSGSSRVSTPRGRDHLYFKENTEPYEGLIDGSQGAHMSHDVPSKDKMAVISITQRGPANQSKVTAEPAAKDLLKALLDQGSKLRDAMVESALRLDPPTEPNADSVLPPVLDEGHYGLQALRVAPERLTSHIDQNLLNVYKSLSSNGLIQPSADDTAPEMTSETRAIELLLGSSPVPVGQFWDGTGSPPESIAGSDCYNESELNDPLYDQSLLENLFYKAPTLDDSDVVSNDDQPKSRRKKTKTTKHEIAVERKSSPGETEEALSFRASSRSPERWRKDGARSETLDLSIDRLALLGRIHAARVIVESLKIKPESNQVTPSKGKPPRPTSATKRTFFVEFHFPVSSKNKAGEATVATEVTRLVSSKIVNGVVKFQQRFVFPVLFHGQTIQHWWDGGLTFQIFMRKSTQKKPGCLGSAVLSLRDVLRSQDLSVSQSLPVRCLENQRELEAVGPLKVSVAIAGDSREFSNIPEKSSMRPNVSIMEPEDPTCTEDPPDRQPEPAPLAKQHVLHQTERPRGAPSHQELDTEEESGLLLHVVLMVPEGKDFVCDPAYSSICNPYLNCKLFSTLEASRSAVVWGSNQPLFSFSQVAPVTLTSRLLERMKNNVMIIEVWSKVPGPGMDQLLGLAKLPLHQFYMSFSDSKICRLLLQAQYPVVVVDSFVPIVDMLSSSERGRLKVLLAIGSGDQVVALQRLKNEEVTSATQIPRPAHFLDPPQSSAEMCRVSESSTDHVFKVHVENVKGLAPLQSTVWGEADCFVQYFFPGISVASGLDSELPERGLSLKPVRTATTLCVPDPVFNDRQSHSLVAPSDTPVQRLLLGAFSMQGLSAGGGMTFEIWCRYYYPNVRDQLVAKALLPLSRLCAMVTMHHREEPGIQAFCLPLSPVSEASAEAQPPSSGLLNVNVTYRRSIRSSAGMLATRMASISVQIHRVSGLQAAARVLAQRDASLQYSADVGVNAFITIRPSFLPEMEVRNTRTIARSFCPEFDHHSEFPCNLVTQRSSGEACSLAEVLQSSEITFSIYHQCVTSGLSGWFPVMVSEDPILPSTAGFLDNVVGGLELSVGFAHHADRERVLEAARGLGWTEDEGGDQSGDGDELVNLSVTTPKIWLPVHCLLLAGHKRLHKSTYCYLRYKLYDRDAVCSPLRRPTVSEDAQRATVVFEQTRTVELMKHQPLVWYLREEKLEIQIWRSYGKDTSGPRPQDTDRLLGCAYVDLTALSENTSRTLSVSGVYPLFKHNAPNLGGAAVRVHLSLSSAYHPSSRARCPSSPEDETLTEDDEPRDVSREHPDERPEDPNKCVQKEQSDPSSSPGSESVAGDLENTFAVNILVERAMHLSLKGSPLTERAVAVPSCSVSFPVAGTTAPVTTPIIDRTDSPTWNFQHQVRLSTELLLDPQQTLVFKVWHKAADVERVLGFASVDLCPLLSGFQSVCGWYNIGDFAGQCQGQIKVSITPLENISHLKEERRLRIEAAPRHPGVLSHPSSLYHSSPALFGPRTTYPAPPPADVADVPSQATTRENIFPSMGHNEHLETVRRFQESVQQAERNTWSADCMDALPQSSRSSLLSALRKNLGELDDIQKYFNQKLYRSLSSCEPSGGRSLQKAEPKPPSDEDTETRLLLTRSNLLVSQVSNLISGLQENRLFQGPTSSGMNAACPIQHRDAAAPELSPDRPPQSAQVIGHQKEADDESHHRRADTPPFSTAGSPTNVEDDLSDPPLREGSFFLDLHAGSSDDEEYEENVIEPRTLNEVTTMTDRTSPWSSLVSDTEPDFMEPDPADGPPAEDHTEGAVYKVDRSSGLGSEGFSESQSSGKDPRITDCARNEAQDAVTGRDLPTIQTPDLWEDGGWEENREEAETTSANLETNDVCDEEPDVLADKGKSQDDWTHQDIGPSEEDPADPLGRPSRHTHYILGDQEEGRSQYDWTHQDTSPSKEDPTGPPGRPSRHLSYILGDQEEGKSQDDSTHQDTSPSEEEPTDPPGRPSRQLLSDPLILPNFFLPPEHLEASMRSLSLSPAIPSSAPKGEDGAGVSRGIPFRRRPRQVPSMAGAALPKAEVDRIARIFAAQFPDQK
ncbi:C2 domain-containing protein 3 [Anomaloglossus baeobatrachus]|uniref:C2 domain-containing protein 3 n=1 Tax=Anomaloglossus baeobatrachus TaxID=238106 RepID=UPI003F50806A